MYMQVALSDTGIPKVNVSVSAASDEEPEVDVSDEEFLQFDTSGVPVIITLTKVMCSLPNYLFFGVEYLSMSRHTHYWLHDVRVQSVKKWSNL